MAKSSSYENRTSSMSLASLSLLASSLCRLPTSIAKSSWVMPCTALLPLLRPPLAATVAGARAFPDDDEEEDDNALRGPVNRSPSMPPIPAIGSSSTITCVKGGEGRKGERTCVCVC